MSDSSDNHDLASSTSVEAANPTEQTTTTLETPTAEEPRAAESPQQVGDKDSLRSRLEAQAKTAEKEGRSVIPDKRSENPDVEAARKKAEGEAPAGTDGSPGEKPPENKYEPNFKYRAFGKEKELDEFWRPLIKDADSEKKVKEIFTRADAFDEMKSKYESTSQEAQTTLQHYSALDRDVRRVSNYLNKGDFDNFFASLRISDDQILQYLQNKADIAKLSPQQQMQYQQGVEARSQQQLQQEQYEQLQTSYTSQAVQARTMQLDLVLSRPDVDRVASVVDQRMGNNGAFRDLVIQEAKAHFLATNEDLPADKAVQMALDRYGKLIDLGAPSQAAPNQQPTPAPQAPAAPQGQTGVVMNQGKPVIPNVKGRGTSPVKQVPKSLADLKKIGRQMAIDESRA